MTQERPDKLTTIETGELSALYNLFMAVKKADDKPTKKNAQGIKSAYIEAVEYYDKHEPRRR